MATFSFAAHNRFVTPSSICEPDRDSISDRRIVTAQYQGAFTPRTKTGRYWREADKPSRGLQSKVPPLIRSGAPASRPPTGSIVSTPVR